MAGFEQLDISTQVEKRYVNKRFVYVEGKEDARILREFWFTDRGAVIEFHAAGNSTGGGGNRVIQQVGEDRDNGIEAYGLVDRDTLKGRRDWENFFEIDDEQFTRRQPLGPYIHVLRLWEIENYLLHPEAIEEFVALEQERTPRSLDEVLAELFELICCYLLVVAANILLNSYGYKPLESGFGRGQTLQAIHEGIVKKFNKLPPEIAEAFDDCIEKVVVFGQAHPPRTLDQWLALLRILDGKCLIDWLKYRHPSISPQSS